MTESQAQLKQLRQEVLEKYQLLGTKTEERFDRITRLAAKLLGAPISLITLVDQDKRYFKSTFGTTMCEPPQGASMCRYTVENMEQVMVGDTMADERFVENPLVAQAPHIRRYAGMPLVVDDVCLGSLCVIGFEPEPFTDEQKEILNELTSLLCDEFQLHRMIRESDRDREILIQQGAELQELNATLEVKVESRTRELQEAKDEVLQRLGRAAAFRDNETDHHVKRVGLYSGIIARQHGLDRKFCELIERAAPLHDLGKIGVSDLILHKPGRLTPEEFQEMKAHALIGANLLDGGETRLMQIASEIAATHHERWDGTGYPTGLAGEDIPLSGRIVAIADVFDALTTERPYKEAWPMGRAIDEIVACSGTHFDPDVVETCLRALPEIRLVLNYAEWEDIPNAA